MANQSMILSINHLKLKFLSKSYLFFFIYLAFMNKLLLDRMLKDPKQFPILS